MPCVFGHSSAYKLIDDRLEFDDEIVPSIEQHSETDAQAAKRKKNRRKTRHGKACTLAQPPGREKSQSQSHSHSQSQEKDAPAWRESSTLSKRARRRNRRFMQRRLRRDTELLELQLQAA